MKKKYTIANASLILLALYFSIILLEEENIQLLDCIIPMVAWFYTGFFIQSYSVNKLEENLHIQKVITLVLGNAIKDFLYDDDKPKTIYNAEIDFDKKSITVFLCCKEQGVIIKLEQEFIFQSIEHMIEAKKSVDNLTKKCGETCVSSTFCNNF